MTESAPVRSQPVPHSPDLTQARAAAEALEALVTRATEQLRQVERTLRLSGEVIQRNPDGTIRIHTEQGDIDVRLPPGLALRPGDDVEIEIQPGKPPQTAVISREEPATSPSPARGAETPVEIAVRNQPAPQTRPAEPLPGQPITLEPLAAQEALRYIAEPLEIISLLTVKIPEIKAQIAVMLTQDEINNYSKSLVHLTVSQNEILSPLTLPSPQWGEAYEGLASARRETSRSWVSGAIKDQAIQIFPRPFFSFIVSPPALKDIEPFASIRTRGGALNQILEKPFHITADAPPKPLATSTLSARIAGIDPPAPQTGTPETKPLILFNAKAFEIAGEIIGYTPEKFPVIGFFAPADEKSEPGNFYVLRAPLPVLPKGSTIYLAPQEFAPQEFAPMTAAAPMPFFAPGEWPLMQEIFQALVHAAPQGAQAFANIAPSPANPTQLGPMALFFLAAVNGGDLTQWLGDKTMDVLRRAGKTDLITKLTGEGSALSRLAADAPATEWRMAQLPLIWENRINVMTLHYRQDSSGGDSESEGGRQVRFIFDLALDKMGEIQLDGLFRPRRLDLIVRAGRPFSQTMQTRMRQAYINALEPTEVRGELSFQSKPEKWVTIKATAKKFGATA